MAYTLRFIFSGLCMFVPDNRDAANPKMHVLLPDTRPHSGHGVDPHFVQLFYDQGRKKPGKPKIGLRVPVSLEDQDLVVPRIGTPIDLTLRPQIVNISDTALTGKKVPRAAVDTAAPGGVWSRITLQSGKIEICKPGARWKFGAGEFRCMTNHVVWRIDVTDASSLVTLVPSALHGGTAEVIGDLHGSSGNGEIDVEIYNARLPDLPTSIPGTHTFPGGGFKANHFNVFYDLVGGSALGPPELDSDVGTCPASEEEHLLSFAPDGGRAAYHAAVNQAMLSIVGPFGVDPYRCMVASGELA